MSNKRQLPVPEGLRELGITEVTDNVPPGGRVHVPASLIMQFFGKEIQKRFMTGGQYGKPDNTGGTGE